MYTTKIKYTYDEYKKLSEFSMNLQLRKTKIICYLLVALISVFTFFVTQSIYGALLTLIVALFIPLMTKFNTNRLIRKIWNSNKLMQNDEVEIIFDDSGWSTVNERGTYHYKYDDIYKIAETKTNIYIFISINMATILVKDNCSEEMIDFVRKLKK